jgi:replicative DNA helicase
MNDLVLPEYFEDRILSWFFVSIRNYYLDYRKKPTKLVLERELERDATKNKIDKDDLTHYYNTLNKIEELGQDTSDIEYVTKETIRFCKRQSVRKALLEVAPMTDSNSDDVWDNIEEIVRKSTLVGNSALDIGTQYFEDIIQRLSHRTQFDTKIIIPTGIPELDKYIGGGLKAGQLGVVVGGTGAGKSIYLPHVGKRAILNGYKVAHYTLELDEKDIAERYDAAFSSIKLSDLLPKSKELEKKLTKLKTKYGNSLLIKFYPTGTASVSTIRNHLTQLNGHGFVPDMVIVDYGDLLKPLTNYHDEYSDLGKIFEGLRGIAGEFQIPIWTATQLNRSGMSAEIADVEHIGDSIKKAQIADILVAICMNKQEKENNEARLHVAKNRNGPSKVIVHIKTAYDKMKFYDLGVSTVEEEEQDNNFRRKPAEPTDESLF